MCGVHERGVRHGTNALRTPLCLRGMRPGAPNLSHVQSRCARGQAHFRLGGKDTILRKASTSSTSSVKGACCCCTTCIRPSITHHTRFWGAGCRVSGVWVLGSRGGYVYLCMHVCMYACIFCDTTCMHVFTPTQTHASSLYVCMCILTCTHTQTHVFTYTPARSRTHNIHTAFLLLNLGSAVALGVLLVHCVGFE